MLFARVEERLLGGSVDVFDAFGSTMVRDTHDFIVFMILWLFKCGVSAGDINSIVIRSIVVKVYDICGYFWILLIVLENAVIDNHIFVLLVVFYEELQIVAHARGIHSERVLLVAAPLLNDIIEEEFVAWAREWILLRVVGVGVCEVEWEDSGVAGSF